MLCLLAADTDRGSNCPLSRAMDGHIMCCGIIGSYQSAATSETSHESDSCKRRYNKSPDLYLYIFTSFSASRISVFKVSARCVTRLRMEIERDCNAVDGDVDEDWT